MGSIRPFRVNSAKLVLTAVLTYLSLSSPTRAQAPVSREIGCFPDSANADPLGTRGRDLDGAAFKDPSMTVNKCLRLCKDQGFRFAGLQNGTWCFCGDSYGRHKAGDASCTTKCAGDKKLICGGEWANSIWELLDPKAVMPPAEPSPPALRPNTPVRTAPGAALTKQRFNRPKLGGIRIDSRPAAASGFDVGAVAHSFCRRMGFSRMIDYRVADARQTIAIEDSTVFTNNKGTNTTYRFIVCGL